MFNKANVACALITATAVQILAWCKFDPPMRRRKTLRKLAAILNMPLCI
jgi:hypothetical protein